MLLFLFFACYEVSHAKRDAATWIGPGGQVLGCMYFSSDSYWCDVEDTTGRRSRLTCDEGCVFYSRLKEEE